MTHAVWREEIKEPIPRQTVAADAAAKAAQVTLIEVRTGYAVGGKGYFTLTGDVGAVRAAVAAAEKQSELYIGSTVIPRPSKQVLESLL